MFSHDHIVLLSAAEVAELLEGHDEEIITVVAEAYKTHARGQTSVPLSTFLTLPNPSNRIIALPAYIGGAQPAAGIKWIASVPENVKKGLDRASALIILNDLETGRPQALLSGSLISIKRTAASAVLFLLLTGANTECLAILGCGPVNYHIARLSHIACPSLTDFIVFDIDSDRATAFATRIKVLEGVRHVRIASSVENVCSESNLVSIATTASQPYIDCAHTLCRGSVVLHISLRDIAPSLILKADNIVDDQDHACRAETSLHLAEKQVGNRDFIRCTLGDILLGKAVAKTLPDRPVIFSPFGLGILDVAVAAFVVDQAVQKRKGTVVPGFGATE